MAYAVIKTGGKQYRVAIGDLVDVEKLDAEPGAELTIPAIFHTDGDTFKTEGLSVTAEVVEQFKDKKVIHYRYKRRKGYHRTVGHRRRLTTLKITAINA